MFGQEIDLVLQIVGILSQLIGQRSQRWESTKRLGTKREKLHGHRNSCRTSDREQTKRSGANVRIPAERRDALAWKLDDSVLFECGVRGVGDEYASHDEHRRVKKAFVRDVSSKAAHLAPS